MEQDTKRIWYVIYDSRYTYGGDGAVMLGTSESLEGAFELARSFGSGNVVIQMEDDEEGNGTVIQTFIVR